MRACTWLKDLHTIYVYWVVAQMCVHLHQHWASASCIDNDAATPCIMDCMQAMEDLSISDKDGCCWHCRLC